MLESLSILLAKALRKADGRIATVIVIIIIVGDIAKIIAASRSVVAIFSASTNYFYYSED